MRHILINKLKREVMKMQRNDPCWCGSGKKYKKCHMPIEEQMMLHKERGEIVPPRKLLKTPYQIEKIKESVLKKDFYKRYLIILIGIFLLALDYNLFSFLV